MLFITKYHINMKLADWVRSEGTISIEKENEVQRLDSHPHLSRIK